MESIESQLNKNPQTRAILQGMSPEGRAAYFADKEAAAALDRLTTPVQPQPVPQPVVTPDPHLGAALTQLTTSMNTLVGAIPQMTAEITARFNHQDAALTSAKTEIISSLEEAKKLLAPLGPRPWWHYALGGTGAVVAGVAVATAGAAIHGAVFGNNGGSVPKK